MAAIPVGAFYAADPPTHYVRFAFCKQHGGAAGGGWRGCTAWCATRANAADKLTAAG